MVARLTENAAVPDPRTPGMFARGLGIVMTMMSERFLTQCPTSLTNPFLLSPILLDHLLSLLQPEV